MREFQFAVTAGRVHVMPPSISALNVLGYQIIKLKFWTMIGYGAEYVFKCIFYYQRALLGIGTTCIENKAARS